MRRIIRIFLASSIVEFANERMAIENFIRNISDKFEENYDVKIQPLLCENFDDAYSKIRKQEEYNEKIRNSDLCFFIFFTKAGEYTREEFEVARKKFEETGKPKIYTYFKVIKDETAEQSLYDFMDELDKIFGHYYGTFEHIDTVKLRILLNLKLQEMDFLEIKVDGDTCVVDGKKTLSLENVSEFANNSIFQELKAELYEVEERYFNLKAKYEKDECSQSEEREYIEIASKRQNLIDAIEEIQKNIFNMSLRMCQDEARGEITLRQKEAYRLFEAGDLEGANNILDFAEIKNDYQRRKAIREAEQKKDAQIFIREGRTKIDILTMMSSLSTRFEEIEGIYDEITDVAFEEQIEFNTVIDYVWFLYEQNKCKKALKIAEDIIHYNKCSAEKLFLDEFALYNSIAVICESLILPTKAEAFYLKAIEIGESCSKSHRILNPSLAAIYSNIGVFYKEHGNIKKAKGYFLKAIENSGIMATENHVSSNADLAEICNNIGAFYSEYDNAQKAEEFFLKAIAIRKLLANENSKKFNADLAESYNNAGIFFCNQRCVQNAEHYFFKAIAIREQLANENPKRFKPCLAKSYDNVGVLYCYQGNMQKSEAFFLKAIAIRERLADEIPEKFNLDFAESCNNIGGFYYYQGDMKKAKKYYKKSIEIYEKLAMADSKRFNPYLAMSNYNYAFFTKNDAYLQKALSLAKTMPENTLCKKIIKVLESK